MSGARGGNSGSGNDIHSMHSRSLSRMTLTLTPFGCRYHYHRAFNCSAVSTQWDWMANGGTDTAEMRMRRKLNSVITGNSFYSQLTFHTTINWRAKNQRYSQKSNAKRKYQSLPVSKILRMIWWSFFSISKILVPCLTISFDETFTMLVFRSRLLMQSPKN